jgi:hypothetical protein
VTVAQPVRAKCNHQPNFSIGLLEGCVNQLYSGEFKARMEFWKLIYDFHVIEQQDVETHFSSDHDSCRTIFGSKLAYIHVISGRGLLFYKIFLIFQGQFYVF